MSYRCVLAEARLAEALRLASAGDAKGAILALLAAYDALVAELEAVTARADALEAEKREALEAALPWFEEADIPGAAEIADRIRAALFATATTKGEAE